MNINIAKIAGFSLLAIAFALLSLGHKTRLGHDDTIMGHIVMSVGYEIAALISIGHVFVWTVSL